MAKYKWYEDNNKIKDIVNKIEDSTAWSRPDEIIVANLKVDDVTYNLASMRRGWCQSLCSILTVESNKTLNLTINNRITKSYIFPVKGTYLVEAVLPDGPLRICKYCDENSPGIMQVI